LFLRLQVVVEESARDKGKKLKTGIGNVNSRPRRGESVVIGKVVNLIHWGHRYRAEVKEKLGVIRGISRSLIRGSILQLDRGHGDNSMVGVAHFDTKDKRSFRGIYERDDCYYCYTIGLRR
jgi:hypothetical protein